ncbi:hypothetical protein CAter282_2267 [Collimonas arenae]|uniref:Uncharacterized protein n=1 Tax=Collimonas arenae TaxID=279058 RepID=A0A127PQP5_9BURK|nr:hypothetical protein CAter10_2470 [Collimonas arenae]AMP10017.1 hypothetical protein CAter282_2267 [Collimonas arenae]
MIYIKRSDNLMYIKTAPVASITLGGKRHKCARRDIAELASSAA